jgi:transcriptional regulator of arginine metabolism
MTKKERLVLIEKLIEKYDIATQDELTVRCLELGYDISQSTISRDIKELNLIKVDDGKGGVKYSKSVINANKLSPQIINLFKHITISIESANNLIVLKTLSGNAGTAGTALDEMKLPQVLGTVAGDDTVLIIAKSNADADIIVKTLKAI